MAAGKWKEDVLDATKEPAACIQMNLFLYKSVNELIGKEDCLYLNVYTPKVRVAAVGYGVMSVETDLSYVTPTIDHPERNATADSGHGFHPRRRIQFGARRFEFVRATILDGQKRRRRYDELQAWNFR